MTDQIRVLLVDDHSVLRGGLKALLSLEEDLDVVGEAGTGEEAVERTRSMRPHVVVMDLGMPGMGGLEALRQIIEIAPEVKVLVLTSHAEEEYLLPVLEAGGSGYVQKTGADTELIEAIRTVARNEVFLYPSATKLLLRGYRMVEEAGNADPLEALSEREHEVLGFTAGGFSSTEIGKKLFLSPKTVDNLPVAADAEARTDSPLGADPAPLRTGLLKAKETPPPLR